MKVESVSLKLGSYRLLVTRPHSTGVGRLALDILHTLHAARAEGTSAYFVRPDRFVYGTLFDLRANAPKVVPRSRWLDTVMSLVWRARRLAEMIRYPWRTRGRVQRRLERNPVTRYLTGALSPPYGEQPSSSLRWKDLYGSSYRRSFADPIPVYWPAPHKEEALRQAEQIGISEDNKLVTLHVREAGYWGTSRHKDAIRDARIETYFDAVGYLVMQGYTVVRLGDPTMTPLHRPGVIDLATAHGRSEPLEIWCLEHSDFFVGCESGPAAIALLVGTPILMLNAIDPILPHPVRDHSLYVFKRAKEPQTDRLLSLEEMLTLPNYLTLRKNRDIATETYDDPERLDLVDNTSQEIYEAVREMVAFAKDQQPETEPQREFERLLYRLAADLTRKYGSWRRKFGTDSIFLGTGRIAHSFAKRHLHSSDETPASLAGNVVET